MVKIEESEKAGSSAQSTWQWQSLAVVVSHDKISVILESKRYRIAGNIRQGEISPKWVAMYYRKYSPDLFSYSPGLGKIKFQSSLDLIC